MKHQISTFAAFVMAIGSVVFSASAQPGRQDGGQNERGPGAGGRFGGPGGGAFMQGVSSREVDDYAKRLSLTSDQKTAVDALFDAYQEEFRTMARDARAKFDSLQQDNADAPQGGGAGRWAQMAPAMNEFRTKRETLEKKFFDDFKTVLTPEQAEQWPGIERDRRRERTVGRGMISGERVDIVDAVDQLNLSDTTKNDLAPILEQYKADLDRELIARNTFQEEMMTKMSTVLAAGDTAAMDKLLEEGRKIAQRVRDVNQRYARQVSAALPADSHDTFDQIVQRETFPMIYGRPSPAMQQIDTALKFEGIDETQKTALTGLKDSVTRDLAAVNKKMETAWQEREQNFKASDIMRGGGGGGGAGGGPGGGGRGGPFGAFENDEIRDLRRQRRDIEDNANTKLRALLTPEQAEKLPQQDNGPGRQDRRDGQPPENPRGGRGRNRV